MPETVPNMIRSTQMMLSRNHSDMVMTTWVTGGSSPEPPNSANISSKAGITHVSITKMTTMAMTKTLSG